MTKLLVLSDSHGGRAAIERVLMKESKSIDALIFLGDGLRDLELALTQYPQAAGLLGGGQLRLRCTGTHRRPCRL